MADDGSRVPTGQSVTRPRRGRPIACRSMPPKRLDKYARMRRCVTPLNIAKFRFVRRAVSPLKDNAAWQESGYRAAGKKMRRIVHALDTGGGAACYNHDTSSLDQFLAQPIWEMSV